jgi:hypothetical protein
MSLFLRDVVERPELLLGKKCGQVPVKHEQGCPCEECGYERLGEEVERHPIGGGPMRRG